MKIRLIVPVLICLLSSFTPHEITWTAIGDSITYLNNHVDETGNRITGGYMTKITAEYPNIKYINQGHNGWTTVGIAKEIENLGLMKSDVYSVFLGTNDWWQGLPLGTINDYNNNTGLKTTYGAYRIIINKIRNLNPTAKIILITPMQRTDFVYLFDAHNNAYGCYKPKNGQALSQFADAVKEIGRNEHFPVIDLYYKSGMTIKNAVKFKRLKDSVTGGYNNIVYPKYIGMPFHPGIDEYPYPVDAIEYTYDGLHPSDKGHQVIADMIIKVFKDEGWLDQETRPRIVITADPELDDNNSMIRFLLYSSDLDVEGLIYASSGYHWKGDGKGTKWYVPGREYARFGLDTCPCVSWRWAKDERFIDDVVEAYGKVYPNLKVHNPNYPSPDLLKSKIRYGNIEFDGDISKNSPGSDLIRSLMLDDKPGKLYITAWGGQSTIARALKSIQEEYEYTTQWEEIKKKISRKVVLLPSGDQDDTYAKYIQPNWPNIDYRQFSGGPNYGYGAQLHAKPEDSVYLTSSWMKENVSDRGPFGALYRVWGDGKQMVKGDIMDYFGFSGYTNEQLRSMGYAVWMPVQAKGSWLGEGDDFTFMNMPGNGLRAYEMGSYGGWGGRETGKKPLNVFAMPSADTSQQAMVSALSSATDQANKSANGFPDFFPAAQRDFAARLKWSITPDYSDANHAPVVKIEGPLNVLASPGETIKLNGAASDPDGNKVTMKWWQILDGTYPDKINFTNQDNTSVKLLIPKNAASGQTIHVILEATDNGSPALTAYQRVIITIK